MQLHGHASFQNTIATYTKSASKCGSTPEVLAKLVMYMLSCSPCRQERLKNDFAQMTNHSKLFYRYFVNNFLEIAQAESFYEICKLAKTINWLMKTR